MSKTNKQPKPVSGSEKQRQAQVTFERVADPLEPLNFERVNIQIDFWDFEKNPVFTGVFLGIFEPEKLKGQVYLFSEFDSHELFYIPCWHSIEKIKECTALCETVYRIQHVGVKTIGNNQTYHVCKLFIADKTVLSRIDEIPDVL